LGALIVYCSQLTRLYFGVTFGLSPGCFVLCLSLTGGFGSGFGSNLSFVSAGSLVTCTLDHGIEVVILVGHYALLSSYVSERTTKLL
jgi:hypothetical protein